MKISGGLPGSPPTSARIIGSLSGKYQQENDCCVRRFVWRWFPLVLQTYRARLPANGKQGRIAESHQKSSQWPPAKVLDWPYHSQPQAAARNVEGGRFRTVTDARNERTTLLESDEQLRLLIETVREYAIFQLDPQGRIMSWNTGAERLKGYTASEVLGKSFKLFYDASAIQAGKPEANLARAAREGECEDEGWRLRKDGSRFWASVVITALRDSEGTLRGFIKITRDMTERVTSESSLREAKKQLELRVEQRAELLGRVNLELRNEIHERQRIEQELRKSLDRLRALAARLQMVREEERTRVAREMHDELGQACTAIKMDLASIGRKTSERQVQLRTKIDSAMQLVDRMIFSVRRIASELRPRTLDDLGLTSALEWQAQEFQRRTGIRCALELPAEQLALDAEQSTAIFRIFQESLTNVARHAHATEVTARVEMDNERLVFGVRDNGKGFDAKQANIRKSLGVVGMQERALALGGELEINGVPGSGTTVTLRIPLRRENLQTIESG